MEEQKKQEQGSHSFTAEFVPYELAVKLKELGFNEPCFGYWNIDPQLKTPAFNMVKPFEHEWCLPAPTFSQCFRWFREKHNLFLQIGAYEGSEIPRFKGNVAYFVEINLLVGIVEIEKPFKTYEEAEQACLDKLIKIVKDDNTNN